MGADAIGINCSLGPREMPALVEELTRQAVETIEHFAEPEFHIWLARSLAARRN